MPSTPDLRNRRTLISGAARAIADMGLIWREAAPNDIGLDAEVEFVEPSGAAAGRVVGLRVEGMASDWIPGAPWRYTPDARLQRYWEAYPLPLVLVFHDPSSGASCWLDARTRPGGELRADRAPALDPASTGALMELPAPPDDAFLQDLDQVLGQMVRRRCGAHFPISHFDLFAHGLTDVARSIYFGSDLALFIAERNFATAKTASRFRAGPQAHAFLFDFVRFLASQNLASVNVVRCLVDWVDRGRQPQFVAPLTERGRSLVRLIQAVEKRMVVAGAWRDAGFSQVAQEAFFGIAPPSLSPRLDRIRTFQKALSTFPSRVGRARATPQQAGDDLASPGP